VQRGFERRTWGHQVITGTKETLWKTQGADFKTHQQKTVPCYQKKNYSKRWNLANFDTRANLRCYWNLGIRNFQVK